MNDGFKDTKRHILLYYYIKLHMILKGNKKIPACIFVAAAIFDDAVFSHLKEEKIINTTF